MELEVNSIHFCSVGTKINGTIVFLTAYLLAVLCADSAANACELQLRKHASLKVFSEKEKN